MNDECKAVDGFYICELRAGHTCRHRDGDYTWMDERVDAARAQARQNKEKTEGEPLGKLLAMLDDVNRATNWKTDTYQKALWLDGILERYRATQKI